ncbi:MAG TPA: hypothetical protein ENH82_05255 [bacterium]|nr:hypothetical protein [bacterium]
MTIAKGTFGKMMSEQNGRCYYCGIKIELYKNLNIEHCIPKSRNGTGSKHNLVLSCYECNMKKNTRTIDEFRELYEYKHAFYFEKIGLIQKGRTLS